MILEDLYRLLEGQHVQAQGIVDTMTQPVVVLDRNLCVTTANNAFLKTFKVERGDVLGEQEFIVAETRHRMKNFAAVVRAIAMQTKAQDPAAVEYRNAFLGRLDVALRAQEVAASHETIDLETLLQEAIGELGVGRLYTTGPTVELVGKRVIFAASMIFHELATNAVKHGALSVAKGTIDVRWSLEPGAGDRRWLNCTWREANGPKVNPPSRKGYGTELIEGMSAQAGGSVKLKYDPGGLIATISLPL